MAIISYKYYVLYKSHSINKSKQEDAFQKSLKNIYDEHIFSITHELRSPLAVIASSVNNQNTILKNFYNHLPYTLQEQYLNIVRDLKQQISYVKNQSETIESFIKSISEHASYVSDSNDKRSIDLHKYLVSILINANSFSRNMRVFQNNISFGDMIGADFINISIQVNPHDLSRMLTNIMTNAADAVDGAYKLKKLENPDYIPHLKIHAIKSSSPNKKLTLNSDFLRITPDADENPQSLYVIIEDNGPGISKENITKIFRYGGFSTKKKDDEGHFGLGLQLSVKLAAKNNIKLYVRTNSEGTMFVLGFPKTYINENTYNYKYKDSGKIYNSTYVSNSTEKLFKDYISGEKTDIYPTLDQK